MNSRFHKVLIANRAEIACRVIRSVQALGYRAVAVYSEADSGAPHVALADKAVCIGPATAAESYLSIERILDACKRTGADALHPGYGFLSENPALVEACEAAGVCFIGPSASAMRLMGDKALAKQRMIEAGVPTAAAYLGADQSLPKLMQEADRIGYPLLIKATAGGGGRGIRVVRAAGELKDAVLSAQQEAKSAFGNATVLLERFIERGRHVEVQVFADSHGNAVYLGDRDCTAQRRRQKVIEEAPAPDLSDALRAAMGESAVQAALSIGYCGAGTVELMLDRAGNYHFLEMNTRLQVEHPVTELVTGLDLVALQLRIAEGEPLPFTQADVVLRGHAIEARLYAEDPYAGFQPQTGKVSHFVVEHALSQPGVRIDAGVEAGSDVTPHYDAMLAKIMAHGATRAEATRKLIRALEDAPLFGLTTNARFLIDLLRTAAFERVELSTSTLDEWSEQRAALYQLPAVPDEAWTIACALVLEGTGSAFRSAGEARFALTLACRSERRTLHVTQRPGVLEVSASSKVPERGPIAARARDLSEVSASPKASERGLHAAERTGAPDPSHVSASPKAPEREAHAAERTGARDLSEVSASPKAPEGPLHAAPRVADLDLARATRANASGPKGATTLTDWRRDGTRCSVEIDGVRKSFIALVHEGRALLALDGQCLGISEPPVLEVARKATDPSQVLAPLAGRVARIVLQPGAAVAAGDTVCTIEAMKMETRVLAAASGTLRQLHVAAGDQVSAGELLARIELTPELTSP